LLRRITQVIRLGHVQAIETGEMVLDQGRVPVAANTLFIDCTAAMGNLPKLMAARRSGEPSTAA